MASSDEETAAPAAPAAPAAAAEEPGGPEEAASTDTAAAAGASSVPDKKANLRILLQNGKRSDFLVPAQSTVAEVKKHVFDNWPKEWTAEAVEGPANIRLLHFGKFLEDQMTLEASRIPSGTTTTIHLVPKATEAQKLEVDEAAATGAAPPERTKCSCAIL